MTFMGVDEPAACTGDPFVESVLVVPTGSGPGVAATRVLASWVIVPGLVEPPPSFVIVGSSNFFFWVRLRPFGVSWVPPPTSLICLIFGSDIRPKYGV